VLRTGRGGLEDPKLWPLYKYGYGPDLVGFFSQSNFGIVTKACFWLEPKSDLAQGFSISSSSDADLDPMIEALNYLSNQSVIDGFEIGSPLRSSTGSNDVRTAYGPPEAKLLLRRRDGGSAAEWEALAKKVNIPLAMAGGSTRGPRPIVRAKLDYAIDYLQRKKVPGTVQLGIEMPTSFPISIGFGALTMKRPNIGHYYFSPVLKITREDLFAINDTIRNVFIDAGDEEMLDEVGFYGAGGGGPTGITKQKSMTLLMEFLVFSDAEKNRRRRELFKKLVKACGEKGWGEYRTPVDFQDEAQAQFSFNNNINRRFLETLYDAADPNGILSPGRAGIWPKHLRKG